MTLADEFRELNRRFVAAIMERNIEDKDFIKAARELINFVELLADRIDGLIELDDDSEKTNAADILSRRQNFSLESTKAIDSETVAIYNVIV